MSGVHRIPCRFCATVVVILSASLADAQPVLTNFAPAAQFDEQVRWTKLESGVRVFVDVPSQWKTTHRKLVIYATPNGSTIEHTLGCVAAKDRDWRFDLQHVAAQIRRLREVDTTSDVVLVVVQAPRLSWPTFRSEHPNAGAIIRELISSLQQEFVAEKVTLTGHSGGGSFLWSYLNSVDVVPTFINRIACLDSNYSYSDDEHHGDKLLAWIKGGTERRLIVIAYDDREIVFNGKKVVGPQGGTFRASQRMLQRFRTDIEPTEETIGAFQHHYGRQGQIEFFIHPNPENKILHTALVGDMNGLIHAMTLGTPHASTWGQFGSPRAYDKWISPAPLTEPMMVRATIPQAIPEQRLAFPPRPENAPTGTPFREQIASVSRADREAAILRELMTGNVPEFLRILKPIRVTAKDVTNQPIEGVYFVTSDYLAIGTDVDFFRVPMNPQTAIAVARIAQGSLITRKISDDVFAAAELKLAPKPLTENRDAAETFWQHHTIIESQRKGKPLGLLTAGIKKDVVLSNRLKEKPHKVAIYGWHDPDGGPIQPLYVGHVDWYVDYSHGVRLMANSMIVDGVARPVDEVLRDPRTHVLLSDEGPIDVEEVIRAAEWPRGE